MQVGALSSADAISFQPVIYNTNKVDAASMNRVRPVPSDINSEKTDYSGLVGKEGNTNQLRPGETANFNIIMEEQMFRSEQNAARVMRNVDDSALEVASQTANANAFETIERPERPEPEDREIREVARDEERVAAPMTNEQNAQAAITTTITENGMVNTFNREPDIRPMENFRLDDVPTGNELTGGTAFNNVIPEALDVPYSNTAVEGAEARAEETTIADRLRETEQNQVIQNQANNPASNIFQMQRAASAYAVAMGF